MTIRAFSSTDLDAVVAFVAQLNGESIHHIGFFDTHPIAIRAMLEGIAPPPTEGFRLAFEQEQLVGVLGVELDTELGRAWLYGPLVHASYPEIIADDLYAALRPSIPPTIHEYELFCDAHNQMCQAFAARHEIPLHNEAAILSFAREQLDTIPSQTARELDDVHVEAFGQLHKQLFPRTYASAQHLLDKRGPHAKVFVMADEQELHGYIAVSVDLEAGTGYTEYIGVTQGARGQGIGRRLLAAALHWMFSFPQVQVTDLTVATSNVAAIRLYTSLGFKEQRIMRAYRSTKAPA